MLYDVEFGNLALCYVLMVIPLGIFLWLDLPLVRSTVVALVRMTVQLLLVGFYLQFIFKLDNTFVNCVWLFVMIGVADASIIRRAGLRLRYFAVPVAVGLACGTLLPLLVFLHVVLDTDGFLQAQYAIPIGGMIVGNCLRANVVGVKNFYHTVRSTEKIRLSRLAMGATLVESTRPELRKAVEAAIGPTIASMSTIGLVSLPGMMTGVIMGGNDPSQAIKYQMAIMISIFAGTCITVYLILWLTSKLCFDDYGILDDKVFSDDA